jgi:radical SAM/Cys-rich protein
MPEPPPEVHRNPFAGDFESNLAKAGFWPLQAVAIEVLQVNLGRLCNLSCRHCHVDAGPDRRELMSDAVVEGCLAFLEKHQTPTLDLTGGAPEMHPRIRGMVQRARALGVRVILRTNLVVLTLPAYETLPEFFAAHQVELLASLPCYSEAQTDEQRGAGVFERSLRALRKLNGTGYGREGSSLRLDLVTNPVGAVLPGSQAALEREWKHELSERHGVSFHRLLTLTNMPVNRFLLFLQERGQLEPYLQKLSAAFNPRAVDGLMCRRTLSVGYTGRLFDCDFNQMLDLSLDATIFDAEPGVLARRRVRTDTHCLGCTAGCGSSCGGALVSES